VTQETFIAAPKVFEDVPGKDILQGLVVHNSGEYQPQSPAKTKSPGTADRRRSRLSFRLNSQKQVLPEDKVIQNEAEAVHMEFAQQAG